jgi:RNA polymerase sigma-70 factor (ECF subfamily)
VIAIDDKDILLMLQNRDEQALGITAERYGALCRSVARAVLGNDQDAEECLNDALLQIWNAIPPAQPDNYCAYLMKTVRNSALDRYKARISGKRGGGRQNAALDELAELLPAPDNVLSELEQRELLAAITRFLRKLPQKQRMLFVRRYWGFTSFTALAAEFGMRENNVQVTLSRIRKKLHAYLRGEGLL